MAVDQGRARGAEERDRIDPRMDPEAAVLHGHEPALEHRVGAGEVGADPPAAVLHGQGAQPGAVTVQHHRRGLAGAGEVRGEGGVEGEEGGLEGEDADEGEGEAANGFPPLRSGGGKRGANSRVHGAGATPARPAGVRAPRLGRYMSRASAPGSRKSPGVTARAT
jgi:hypothetical protein